MAPITNGRLMFNEVLESGYPIPGKTFVYDTNQTIDLDNVALDGGFLIKTLVLSNDPYLRGKMRSKTVKSYTSMFTVGQPLYNFGIGVVIRSENGLFKPGDHLYGIFDFQEYLIRHDSSQFRIIENKEKIPWSLYVGVAGMPGKTAFCGWKEFSKAKKGETLFVTTGAGQVGSLVIQLAKNDGLRVIGSAGSDEKVNFMRELGADIAFNYKTERTSEILKGNPIDIYWDNVGGETLDEALVAASDFARFIECGMISTYNNEPYPIKNISQVLTKSITMTGFIVMNLESKYDADFHEEILTKIANGEIKYLEDVTKGLSNAGEAILAVQEGKNMGKSVILVAEG